MVHLAVKGFIRRSIPRCVSAAKLAQMASCSYLYIVYSRCVIMLSICFLLALVERSSAFFSHGTHATCNDRAIILDTIMLTCYPTHLARDQYKLLKDDQPTSPLAVMVARPVMSISVSLIFPTPKAPPSPSPSPWPSPSAPSS